METREEWKKCVMVSRRKDAWVLEWQMKVGGMVPKKGRCREWKEEHAFIQCPVGDRGTINAAALAKGIKSTHAWLLFKLIKGCIFWEARFMSTIKSAVKEAGNSWSNFACWLIQDISWCRGDNDVDNLVKFTEVKLLLQSEFTEFL